MSQAPSIQCRHPDLIPLRAAPPVLPPPAGPPEAGETAAAATVARLLELNDELERRVKEEVARNLAVERTLFHQARLAAMGEMLGAIAHQWRQPLNALALLLGNLDDARRHQQVDDAYLARAVSDGHRLVQKMASTINDFRDFARPDKARTRFALRPQIEETLRLLDAGLHHHCISVSIAGDEELEAVGLPNEYSQVLLNLVGNARDAIVARGGGGGGIAIALRREANQALVTVTDDGGGIAVEPIERVFEPYFTTKPGGTGLGLYLSRMILQKSMGGSLHARRVPGGSELTISTPLP